MDWRNSRWPRGRSRLVTATLLLVLLSATSARAQDSVDELEGRILQRSDGALFLFKDGYKYPLLVTDIGDDAINAIPDADTPITELGQAFGPQPVPEAPLPIVIFAPTPTPVPGPYIAVSNPAPGDTLAVGGLDIQGKAFDPSASSDQGSGIDRVQIFLEDRDRGGLHLADARLGFPNPAAAPDSQFALAGWEAVVNLPSGSHVLFIYARSAVTDKESTIEIPVRVGTGG
jgi:hypothetical protein